LAAPGPPGRLGDKDHNERETAVAQQEVQLRDDGTLR
jgi:hypothetical protein